MKNKAIRLVVIFGVVSIIGIIVVQVFWVKRAFDLKEREFNHNVNIALKNVVESLCQYNGTDVPNADVVDQVSTNYFAVNINNMISPEVLEYYLTAELTKRSIEYDFEYGIYDCSDQQMVFGKQVNMGNDLQSETIPDKADFPELSTNDYYFGVYFPSKQAELLGNMGIWTFSSIILLVVLVFFGYAIFVILKQKRLSEIQRDFINNMTHEFKTPISTIAVSTEVLQQSDIERQPERLKNYVGIIQTENNRLRKQVERVLQMAILNKEKMEIKKEPVDLHDILSKVIQNMDINVQEKKGRIQCFLKAAQSRVVGDRLHLTNIFYNLIDNALKYCKGNPQIEVTTTDSKDGVEITFNDNGVGIPKEEQKRVFQRFYRIPTGNVHDVKGFGLGLNYVKTMIAAHNGRITLESSPGKGSSFKLFLPH